MAPKAEQKCSTVVSNSCRAEGPKPHFQQLQGPKAHISTVGGPGEFQELIHSWGAPEAPPNCGTNVGPARRAGKIWGYDAIKHTYLMKLTDAMNQHFHIAPFPVVGTNTHLRQVLQR